MIELRKLTKDHPDMVKVRELHETAFPISERPLSMDELLSYTDRLPLEVLGIYPEENPDEFSGFFLTVKGDAFIYLFFFAIIPDKRSCGLGGRSLVALKEYYKGSQILFSYESVYQESDNAEQRERRRSFYLKNGFYETGWFAKSAGIEFMIASSSPDFDKDAFLHFIQGMLSAVTDNLPLPELYRRQP